MHSIFQTVRNLTTIKSLLATANALFSQQNWTMMMIVMMMTVLKLIAANLSYDDGNFTFFLNTTDPYETEMVQGISPLYVYLTPLLLTLGNIGNMLSVYVFCKSHKLRQQVSSQYLSALAVSDNIFLLQLLPAWLTTMGFDNLFFIQDYCWLFVYLSYVTCSASSWLVLAFTIERCIAVLYPLQHSSMCTVRRARWIIVALTTGALLVNTPVLNFAGTGGADCGVAKEKLQLAEWFNWVDTLLVFTVPLVVILCVNIWIVITLCRFGRMRLKLLSDGREQDSSKCGDSDDIFPRQQRRITNMLLLVSSVFFIFNVPAYVMRVFAYSYDWGSPCQALLSPRLFLSKSAYMDSSENSDTWMAIHIMATVMFYSTFGINFFLYCLSGQNFRRALMQHVPCFGWLAGQCRRLTRRTGLNAARAPSVTISATSNGTEEMCNVDNEEKNAKLPRLKNRWHRNMSAEAGTESFEMRDIAPRAGPSRELQQPWDEELVTRRTYARPRPRPRPPRRLMLTRVVTEKESKNAQLKRQSQLMTLSAAERRKALAHLYD